LVVSDLVLTVGFFGGAVWRVLLLLLLRVLLLLLLLLLLLHR
jgi:hypothetical protein